jgi:assimilatory nitrate reductase catalytic subunit
VQFQNGSQAPADGCAAAPDVGCTTPFGVRGGTGHPANFCRLCSKCSTLHLTASAHVTQQTRLLQPMRRATRDAAPQTVSWDAALDEVAACLAEIAGRRGPDAIGRYISGQLLTEDCHAFNTLAKGHAGRRRATLQ